VLSEKADVLYKTTDYYSPEDERCLLWNDPALAIAWPLHLLLEKSPILTPKDAAGICLDHAEVFD
jgi:dTDP-4-dehydrorhamnose 3,5-epimerase